MSNVTKLDGFAVLGASDTKATSTKALSFAVLGASDTGASSSKANAYAVLAAADAFQSLAKFASYAVLFEPGAQSLTKLDGFAVLGASDTGASSSKAAAYAVLAAADAYQSVGKINNYAVLGASDSGATSSKITGYAVTEVARLILTAGSTDVSNQFKVIRPTAVTDARLISSSVPEADYAIWAAGAFAVGDFRMMTTGIHRIYQCLVAHTSSGASGAPNLNLATLPPIWLEIGPTNRWGMFDVKVGTTTTAANSLTVVIQTGRINSLALLQVDAAAVDVDLSFGGVTVYSATINLTGGGSVGDWYQYFYEPVYQPDGLVITNLLDAALVDLPAYTEGVLTVTLRRTGGTVSCGVLVVGLYAEIGRTEYRPKVSITDFSRKTVDGFGNVDVVKRAYTKRMDASTVVNRGAVDQVTRTLAQYRSTPMVWVGAGNLYTSMIVYGFYKDWDMVIENYINARLSIQVEGLT